MQLWEGTSDPRQVTVLDFPVAACVLSSRNDKSTRNQIKKLDLLGSRCRRSSAPVVRRHDDSLSAVALLTGLARGGLSAVGTIHTVGTDLACRRRCPLVGPGAHGGGDGRVLTEQVLVLDGSAGLGVEDAESALLVGHAADGSAGLLGLLCGGKVKEGVVVVARLLRGRRMRCDALAHRGAAEIVSALSGFSEREVQLTFQIQ